MSKDAKAEMAIRNILDMVEVQHRFFEMLAEATRQKNALQMKKCHSLIKSSGKTLEYLERRSSEIIR